MIVVHPVWAACIVWTQWLFLRIFARKVFETTVNFRYQQVIILKKCSKIYDLFIPFSLLLVLAEEVPKMFIYIFQNSCLSSLQTESKIKKITQPKLPKTKNELTKICNEPGNSQLITKVSPFFGFLTLWYLKLRFISNTFWTKSPKADIVG